MNFMDPMGAILQPTTRGQTVAVEESQVDHLFCCCEGSVRMLAEEEGVSRAKRSQDVTTPGGFTGGLLLIVTAAVVLGLPT